jgi:hypothetical protein
MTPDDSPRNSADLARNGSQRFPGKLIPPSRENPLETILEAFLNDLEPPRAMDQAMGGLGRNSLCPELLGPGYLPLECRCSSKTQTLGLRVNRSGMSTQPAGIRAPTERLYPAAGAGDSPSPFARH